MRAPDLMVLRRGDRALSGAERQQRVSLSVETYLSLGRAHATALGASLYRDDDTSESKAGRFHVSQSGGMRMNISVRRARRNATRLVAGAVVTTMAGSALAQELQEVTVTATRRAENIQEVPIAVTAVTAAQL